MRAMWLPLVGLPMLLAGCGEKQAAAPPPKPKTAKPPHCFFKDNEAKGWTLKKKGDRLVISGRAYRSDARYKTVFLEPAIEGRTAIFRPSIAINDTGFATEDNWWDIKGSVPAANVDTVEIRCGKKILATLKP